MDEPIVVPTEDRIEAVPRRLFAPPIGPKLLRSRPPRPLPAARPRRLPSIGGGARANKVTFNRLTLGGPRGGR